MICANGMETKNEQSLIVYLKTPLNWEFSKVNNKCVTKVAIEPVCDTFHCIVYIAICNLFNIVLDILVEIIILFTILQLLSVQQ